MHYCFFYRALNSNSPLTSQTTKQTWEKDLSVAIDEADWQEVWPQAMNILVSNSTKSIQFRIVHRTHITPVVKNKMDANISPLCWKCNSETSNYGRIADSKHRRLFNILTFAARKNILLFWTKNVAPMKRSWHNIVMDCIPSEYITCMLHSKINAFYKVWDPCSILGPRCHPPCFMDFPD